MFRLFSLFLIIFLTAGISFGATKKKITDPDEALEQARQAFYAYNPEEAREMYDEYAALLKKKKKAVPEEVEDELSRLVLMENMLSRVEKIVVVDSIVVDVDGFFTHYRLSPEAGRIVSGNTVRMADVEMAYVPQNNTEILYSQEDDSGIFVLMGADILDDGTVDHPAPLEGDDLSGGGNAEYPFLLSDGITLYFANDGEGSLGGYDIFLTRRDDDGSYLQPQNIGMPFNSPYDDYLLAIDEISGAGWWATDRNQIPGKVTIYVFKPSDTRVNVDTDDPDLVALATLSDISLTQQGADIEEAKRRIAEAGKASSSIASDDADFEIAIGDTRRIYHSLSDFKSTQARKAMAQAIDARTEIQRIEARLADMREQWSKGKRNQGVAILNLEQQLDEARDRMKRSINEAIAEELKKSGR